MQSYESYVLEYIGSSYTARLIVRSGDALGFLCYAHPGDYAAYICYGDDVAIGPEFVRVFSGLTSLKIYDDAGLVYSTSQYADGEPIDIYGKVDVYRAGSDVTVIHWHS